MLHARHRTYQGWLRGRGLFPKEQCLLTFSGKPGMHEILFQGIHISNRSVNKDKKEKRSKKAYIHDLTNTSRS